MRKSKSNLELIKKYQSKLNEKREADKKARQLSNEANKIKGEIFKLLDWPLKVAEHIGLSDNVGDYNISLESKYIAPPSTGHWRCAFKITDTSVKKAA